MDKSERKTVMLYTNTWRSVTPTLTDAQVGRLMRALMAYATGEDGDTLSDDKVLELALSVMKLGIDEDWTRYEGICNRRKSAGRRGAEKRWQKVANDGKCQQKVANDGNRCPNTNTNTSCTISNDIATTTQKECAHEARGVALSKLRERVYNSQIKLHGIASAMHATVEDVLRTADAVLDEWDLTDEPIGGINMKHLLSQIRLKWDATLKGERKKTADDRKREWLADMERGAIDNMMRMTKNINGYGNDK